MSARVRIIRVLADLLHIPEYFLSTPPRHIPIIVILLRSSDAQRPINTTRSTKELSTADFHLSTIRSRTRLGDNVPIGFGVEVLRPIGVRICQEHENQSTHHPPAITVFSRSELCCPASMTRTELFGSSASRAASTEPEVPPLISLS